MIADFAGRPPAFASSNNAFVAIGRCARRMTDRDLVLAEAIGFGVALATFAWTPRTLEVAFLAVALGSLGFWGVTDHMVEARRRRVDAIRSILKVLRFGIASVGIAAAVLSGYALIGRVMGVFIL